MIGTAVVVPHPPLLVPELAGAAAGETSDLREACVAAGRALATNGTRWLAVGAATGTRGATVHGPGTRGTFAGFGVDVRVALGPGVADEEPDAALPLPVLVAGWLRDAVGEDEVRVTVHVLGATTDPASARGYGAALAAQGEPVGLLVLGDGAATHTARAPGAYDARASAYDRGVADALAAGDAAALAALEPALSDALLAGGRVPWQVLAGAVPAARSARLVHSSAPFGVAYHVAVWQR